MSTRAARHLSVARVAVPAQDRSGAARARRWMDADDALSLWQEYRRSGSPRLRDRLVLAYLPLVRLIVDRKSGNLPARLDIDDLISAGQEALIKAVDRFDAAKGATLEQFLWTRIDGAVIDEMRRDDWAPRSLRRWQRDMSRAQREFRTIHGREPSDREAAVVLSISGDELRRRQRDVVCTNLASLNTLVASKDGADVERVDVLASADEATDPERTASKSAATKRLCQALKTLGRREREVAVLLYVANLRPREIGAIFGVSESRISQIHRALKKKLALQLKDDAEWLLDVA